MQELRLVSETTEFRSFDEPCGDVYYYDNIVVCDTVIIDMSICVLKCCLSGEDNGKNIYVPHIIVHNVVISVTCSSNINEWLVRGMVGVKDMAMHDDSMGIVHQG